MEDLKQLNSTLADANARLALAERAVNHGEAEALGTWRALNSSLYAERATAENEVNKAARALNDYASSLRRHESIQSGAAGRRAIHKTKNGTVRYGVIEIFDSSVDKMPRGAYYWDGTLVLRVLENVTGKRTGEVYHLGKFTADNLSTFDHSLLPNGWTLLP